jgi:hypothetical protein
MAALGEERLGRGGCEVCRVRYGSRVCGYSAAPERTLLALRPLLHASGEPSVSGEYDGSYRR